MKLGKTEKIVYDLALKPAEEKGFEIYDIEFVKEGGTFFLRIFIDKPGGINIDECESFSRTISDILDRHDPISQAYCLEVSSPGIERRLRHREHFEKAVGETVDVHLYKPVKGSKELTGVLLSVDEENNMTLDAGGENIIIPQSDAARVNIHFDF